MGVSGVSGLSVLPFGSISYAQKVVSIAPANLIGLWPHWEANGLVSNDISGNSPAGERDGIYTGLTLGQPGIGDGRTSAFFDGINDYNNIQTASLTAAFNGSEGTLQIWWLNDVAAHGDATLRRLLILRVDDNQFIIVAHTGANSNITLDYRAGGVGEQHQIGIAAHRTAWSVSHMTWSKTADAVTYFDGGVQVSQDTVLGNWAGNLTLSVIGASSLVPATPYFGYLAYVGLWDIPLIPDQVAELAVVP